ncbi:GspE/PulE family protein [Thermodesulfobacteriota bacterium]
MRHKKRLGELLEEAGLVTGDQIKEALGKKGNSSLKIGELLIRQGILNEDQVADYLAKQLNTPRYDPADFPENQDLKMLIPAEIAREHRVVPLSKEEKTLTIGIEDPMDILKLDAIESLTDMDVDTAICTEKEMNYLLSCYYGSYSSLNGVLEDIEGEKDSNGIECEIAAEDRESDSTGELANEAPVVRIADAILRNAINDGASDVHISPEKDYVQIRFRIDGKLHEIPSPSKAMFHALVSRLKVLSGMDISLSRVPQDGRFSMDIEDKEVNIRVSTIPTIYGENVVMRLLDLSSGIHTLESLGMADEDMKKIESSITKPYGMILSTGPTGSGKTTSLYSILSKLNKPDINIMTLEDPVEYRVEKIRQIQLNKKAGMTFADGLRSILRQDPDVIMVGEIRDAETARISVQSALTGHRVLSTVHTNDATGAVTRLLDMGIEPFLVSSVMLLSFSQRLIRKICPDCKESYAPSPELLKEFGINKSNEIRFYKGKGCISCKNTGYKGRTGIFEVLLIDEMVQKLILKRASSQEISKSAQNAGTLKALRDDAIEKVLEGITTLEEAAFAVMT